LASCTAAASLRRVRAVTAGVITTVAGDGTAGFLGDGGPAISARINSVAGASFDLDGKVLLDDALNYRVRKIAMAADAAAPSAVVATAGLSVATVGWVAPPIIDGRPVTGYAVTSLPLGAVCATGPAILSCVVSGLSGGVPHTFMVQAIYADGVRPSSVPSNPVVPLSPSVVTGTCPP